MTEEPTVTHLSPENDDVRDDDGQREEEEAAFTALTENSSSSQLCQHQEATSTEQSQVTTVEEKCECALDGSDDDASKSQSTAENYQLRGNS